MKKGAKKVKKLGIQNSKKFKESNADFSKRIQCHNKKNYLIKVYWGFLNKNYKLFILEKSLLWLKAAEGIFASNLYMEHMCLYQFWIIVKNIFKIYLFSKI